VNEVVYAIWDSTWGEHWFLYELGEVDDGFYCRCVDADSWETLALGLGDSATEALTRAFIELVALAGRESPGGR
jgi:hypothetical protein